MASLAIKTLQFNDRFIGLVGNGERKNFHKIYPVLDALNAEHGTALRLIDPRFAEEMLKIKWPQMLRAFPFATNAVMAHEKPGTPLGAEVIFSHHGKPKYVLPTGKYKGEKDVALVVLGISSADLKRDTGDIVFDVDTDRIIAVHNFPAATGYYQKHAETTLPHGEGAEERLLDDIHLSRTDQAYVGSIVRDADAWTLRTSFAPWDRFGMVITGSQEDFDKVGAIEPDVATKLSRPPPPRNPSTLQRLWEMVFPKE